MPEVIKRFDVTAWIPRRESVRQLRMQRHFVVSALGLVLLVFASAIPQPLLKLVLVAALTMLTLESLARGLNAKWGYLWGWPYPDPKESTRCDVVVDGVVHQLASPLAESETSSKVRPLDPLGMDRD